LAQGYGPILTRHCSITRRIFFGGTFESTGVCYYPGYYHFGIFLFGT
jgi:hypothetical protein